MNFELVYKETPDGKGFYIAYRYSATHWRIMGTSPHEAWLSNAEAATWETLSVPVTP